ncbi:tRNA 2-selenouridine(34) synthase MnmH [Bacteroidota bacterium]
MNYLATPEFLTATANLPVVDVRSPSEFMSGHIPGAINIPLFHDDERAIVGTIYKQQSKKDAIEKGLEIVGPKMSALSKQAQAAAQNGKLGVYCWRGGMRSNRMAWLFEQTGIECTVLEQGYKAYRTNALAAFGELKNLVVIDGPTGSGKTDLLHGLKNFGEQVLDLEGMANHKGSAFGSIGMPEQPTSQQFQNNLFKIIGTLNPNKRIWVEREGMSIGKAYLPQTLWLAMRDSKAIALDVSMEQRVKRLVRQYGQASKEELAKSIRKLQQNLGGQSMKSALELLEADKLEEVAFLLLKYYDKSYAYSKNKYAIPKTLTFSMLSEDMQENAHTLIALAKKQNL